MEQMKKEQKKGSKRNGAEERYSPPIVVLDHGLVLRIQYFDSLSLHIHPSVYKHIIYLKKLKKIIFFSFYLFGNKEFGTHHF